MSFYQDRILPLLIDLAMCRRNLAAYRGRVVTAAEGRVLEIGIGSGLNLPFYKVWVEKVIGLDPTPKLLTMARKASRHAVFPAEFIKGSTGTLSLENGCIDTIVTTWMMSSIVESLGKISFEPSVEFRIRLDCELVDERLWMERRQ